MYVCMYSGKRERERKNKGTMCGEKKNIERNGG